MPFSETEKAEIKVHFDSFDEDHDDHITVDDLAKVMDKIGESYTPELLKQLISEVDTDANGTIEFSEFLTFVEKLKQKKSGGGFAQVFTKAQNLNVLKSEHAQHSFSDEEKMGFADFINEVLGKDPDLKHLGMPLNINNMDLFEKCKDGLLLAKLINYAVPGTIDERAINKPPKLNPFKITENNNLVINSAKAIGCQMVNIGQKDISEGTVHLLLGVIWQIIRIGLLASVNLKNHPELIRLLEPGETLEDLLKLSPEEILLRWFNYHLKAAGHPRRVHNFSGDIKDSEAYTVLLHQLAPKKCDKSALSLSDPKARAAKMLEQADHINCKKFVRPGDVASGNAKLNLAFVANIFNTLPGLDAVEETFEEVVETREEKAFRNWMNSLGVDPYVNNLYEDLRDGIIILQLEDKTEPGCVNWSKVNTKKPITKFKALENCNYAIDIGRNMKLSLVGIGGQDIVAANKMYILAIVWQLMRKYILNFIRNLSAAGGHEITDEDIVKWCNEKAKSAGSSRSMSNFKDKSLANSLFFFDLLDGCQGGSVARDLILPGDNDEQCMKNAQYAISCARKMGCTVFLLWEDIVEVKEKMILTYCGAIMGQFMKN